MIVEEKLADEPLSGESGRQVDLGRGTHRWTGESGGDVSSSLSVTSLSPNVEVLAYLTGWRKPATYLPTRRLSVARGACQGPVPPDPPRITAGTAATPNN